MAKKQARKKKNNDRKYMKPSDEIALCTQVANRCPLSGKILFEEVNGHAYKRYEIAHIYPLNPSAEEIELLKDEAKLSEDPNDLANLIPLEKGTHGGFDKPRTIEAYRKLRDIKSQLIYQEIQRESMNRYPLEGDINKVLDDIYDLDLPEVINLDFESKRAIDKFDATLTVPTQFKVRANNAQYYNLIKSRYQSLEIQRPGCSENIDAQVKSYFLKQKMSESTQQAMFNNMINWLESKSNAKTREALEIVASYHVQHCEIFE